MASKTQIDKLGERLRKGDISEADLRMLDEYRRSFSQSYEFVIGGIRNELGLEPTGRPAKSTTSISEKLLRESIRLTQVQDIAGCRLIVSRITQQERVVESLTKLFKDASVVDRREHPSHGYRAVHVLVKHLDTLVEVQVRTYLQHAWAELSEKLSDTFDPAIKYGGGSAEAQKILAMAAGMVIQQETLEADVANLKQDLRSYLENTPSGQTDGTMTAKLQTKIDELEEILISTRQGVSEGLNAAIAQLA